MITQKLVKELFDYEDGRLFWKTTGSGRTKKEGGCIHRTGYKVVTIKGKQYQCHRVVWLYHHGFWPENDLDHIDRDRANNRIENLREVSRQCNQRNTGNWKTNKSGVKGVYFDKRENKWRSVIRVNMKLYFLGYFDTKQEAVLHRLAAEQCLGWNKCIEKSPAYKYAIKKQLIRKK